MDAQLSMQASLHDAVGSLHNANTNTALGLDGHWQQGLVCSRSTISVHLQIDCLFANGLHSRVSTSPFANGLVDW